MNKMRVKARAEPTRQMTRELTTHSIRTVEGTGNERKFILSFSSEEPYTRFYGTEILDHSEGAVDLSRLNEIGVLLFNHDRNTVIGKINRAWIENNRGQAEVEFDTDDKSEIIYQKVKSGTLKTTSVGYVIDSYEDVSVNKTSKDGRFKGPAVVAVKWTPFEISIVSVPADPTVGVGRSFERGRSMVWFEKQLKANQNMYDRRLIMDNKELRKQKLERQNELLADAKANERDLSSHEQDEFDALQKDIDALTAEINSETEPTEQRAIEAERERVRTIMSLCEDFGLNAHTYIESGMTIDGVRSAVLTDLKNNRAPVAGRGIIVTKSEEDKFRDAAADALLMRGGVTIQNPADGAREMRGMSLRDIAIESLTRSGEVGLNRKSSDELYGMLSRQFFNPSAAFPSILDTTINKAYVEGHKNVEVTFDKWTKKGSLADFKVNNNQYLAGAAGEFMEVPEGGEIKADKFSDVKRPARQLKTYGRQFTLTRQAFINDDIGLVTSIPAKYAAAARRTINTQCYRILVDNPAIYDGTQLFSATHKNLLATGTGITRDAMQKMITALGTQKDEFGNPIIVRPGTLIVPAGMGFDVVTTINSPTINTADNQQAVNPLFRYASSIQVIEDPTINVLCGEFGNIMPWYLIGNTSDTDFIQVDYLNGQEIPTIRRMEAPGTLGFIWDIYLDWGISVMDWRGAVKNNGIVVTNPLA